jgi:hypothetical protein
MCLWIIALFLVPMTLLCGPMWFFGRKRAHWTWLDFSVAWLPFLIWFGLMWMNWMSKSLANLVEALYIGVLMALCPALRLVGTKWMEERKMAWITAVFGAVIAAAVYLITPCLPE